ncbi:MAG: membrane protein insertase YidC [candidate division NC10 bacterium]|nr:membrane protein insertase YidC [candidate division NC10 bacterium]
MEKNAILATVLVILILLGYQWYLAKFETPAPQGEAPAPAPPAAPAPAKEAALPPAAPTVSAPMLAPKPKSYTPTPQAGVAPREIVVDTPRMRVTFSTEGARAVHWQLKDYRLQDGSFVELVAEPNINHNGPSPLTAWGTPEQLRAVYAVTPGGLQLKPGDPPAVLSFHHVGSDGIELKKTVTFYPDRFDVSVALTMRNLAEAARSVQPRLAWGPGFRNSQDKKASTLQPPTLWLADQRHQEDLEKLTGEKVLDGKAGWAALQDQYFAAALLPGQEEAKAFVAKGASDQPIIGLTLPARTLPPGAQIELKATLFAGPRDLEVLKGVGNHLDQLVDLGWFDFLARPALWLLKFLYRYTGNYGFAIILITVLQKVLFHPLTHKSLKSMQAMSAIQPKVQALQERYKNNPKKKQEETMALYRKHGVNPMGGCLPMLVQIPIFVALYNALSSSVEMWQASFLWIRDLTQPDALFQLPLWGGSSLGFNLLALCMGASMWFQQKMSPTAGDPRQAQIMLWMMPIIFTWMFWSFPSGLVLYWLVNNILQIGQQWIIMGRPTRPASPTEALAA